MVGPGHDQQPSPREHPGRPRPARRDRERDDDGEDEAPAGTRPPVGEERRREEREVRATALERRPPRRGAGEGDGHGDQGPRDRPSPGSHQRWRRLRTRDRGGTTDLARHGATLARARRPHGGVPAQDPVHVGDGPHRAAHGAGDLRAPEPRGVGHGRLVDAPAGPSGQHDHLERPSRPAIFDAEGQEVVPAGGAHRPEVVEREVQPPPELEGQDAVGEAGVARPRAPGRPAGRQHEIGVTPKDRIGDLRELPRIEGAVGIHEAHDVRAGGDETGPTGRPEAAARLAHHERTARGSDRGGPVGGAVVDDDRPVAGRQRREQRGQGALLVERRQDHVDGHRSTSVAGRDRRDHHRPTISARPARSQVSTR